MAATHQPTPAKMGRPTKYRPEMCQSVINLMKEGASLIEVAADIGINADTLHTWRKSNTEFSDAVKIGMQLSEAWWMREGREALRDRDFNYTGWYMNMKNRHGWADKVEKKEQHDIHISWGAAPVLPAPDVIDAEIIQPQLPDSTKDSTDA